MSVFHFELRSGIHVAHAFNLSRADLDHRVLSGWRRGEVVVFGDRRWEPDRAQLRIYEGRPLRGPDLSFGRGWTNAVKRGEDVTADLLAGDPAPIGGPPTAPGVDALRREILALCAAGRVGLDRVVWLTNRWYPERRASERLALAETAVWGLLHERLVSLRRAGPDAAVRGVVVDDADWEEILLDWRSWADADPPGVVICAASDGAGPPG